MQLVKYTGPYDNTLICVTHGSRLYGMATEQSDTDLKVIFMPSLKQMLMCEQPKVKRQRFDTKGQLLQPGDELEPGGHEIEWSPVHKFVREFLDGQSWAMEVAFATLQGAFSQHAPDSADIVADRRWGSFVMLCHELTTKFKHRNVKSMADYAAKQVWDYVKRGQRYNEVLAVKAALEALKADTGIGLNNEVVRLNTELAPGHQVMDYIAEHACITVGLSSCNTGMIRNLTLCGRQYLATVKVFGDFDAAVSKLEHEYGERSKRAAMEYVDWKSLAHAIRVYEQLLEYLTEGTISFPRPNGERLAMIKRGLVDVDNVKNELIVLEDQVNYLMANTKLPEVDDAMREQAGRVLYGYIRQWLSYDMVSLPVEPDPFTNRA